MNSVKTLATVAILTALGIGLYIKLNGSPEPEPPPEFDDNNWSMPPTVDVGGDATNLGTAAPGIPPVASMPADSGGSAPAFDPSTGSMAPPFAAASSSESTAERAAPPFSPSTSAPTDTVASSGSTDPFAASKSHMPHVDAAHNPARDTGEPNIPSKGHGSFSQAWSAAQDALAVSDLSDALAVLTPWYFDTSLDATQKRELRSLLGQLAGTVIYSVEHHLESPYTVQAGDTLENVASGHNVPPALLANINGISQNETLMPGTTLKVVRGPFSAVVRKQEQELVLLLGDRYAGRFEIGIGTDQKVIAEGDYEVESHVADPTYWGTGRAISGGDPNNPLGRHFLPLRPQSDKMMTGPFGIHGTNDPSKLKQPGQPGHIRMAPGDIVDVCGILEKGSTVTIRR